jgi:serine/threonine protein kinase
MPWPSTCGHWAASLPSCIPVYRSSLARTNTSNWPVSWRSSGHPTTVSSTDHPGASSSSVRLDDRNIFHADLVDATGAPRPFVNAKGKRRRPNSKTLAQVLKCNDELFIDFISKCLTWDPDRRMKPGPAMRHPWILAGRRRAPPITSQSDRRTSSASGSASRSYLPNANGGSAMKAGASAKHLVISPPTPLVAKGPPSASRAAVSMSANKLSQPMSRTSSFKA